MSDEDVVANPRRQAPERENKPTADIAPTVYPTAMFAERGLLFKAALGHEERFPPTRLSAGCGFRKETIAGMRRNRRDA